MQAIKENDPTLKSFIAVSPESDFPIQNLPFGIFQPNAGGAPRAGVAIGDSILDLSEIMKAGLFTGILLKNKYIFEKPTLNDFIALGQSVWRETRATISQLLRADEPTLRDNSTLRSTAFHAMNAVKMLLPIKVGGYTDFYSSKEHATNVGTMFRGKENPLLPNWTHLPVGYDGRASSIVVSGTSFYRPMGQTKSDDLPAPIFTPTQQLDTEVEVAFIVGTPNEFGNRISTNEAPQHVFGVVLLSDWSARDIQRWEYVPLGPFLSKNFCTSISPWIVTLDALQSFRTTGCAQDPMPLPYLQSSRDWAYDINLQLLLQTEKMQTSEVLAETNYRHIYWDFCQQLAHHTVGGCNMTAGDIFASGTISGTTPNSCGSLLEITFNGKNPIQLSNGEERKFLLDGDTVSIKGWCKNKNYRIGFGEVAGKILPAIK